MAAWKVVIIGLLACACLALAMATIAIPISQEGSQRWVWLGGLLAATIFTGTLLTLFLRYADGALNLKPRGTRN
jgi:cell division protein FtsW (lipid II flippase)